MENKFSEWHFCNPFFWALCLMFVLPALFYLLVTELVKWIVGVARNNGATAAQQATQVVAAAQPVIQHAVNAGAGAVQRAVTPKKATVPTADLSLWAVQPDVEVFEIDRVELPKGYVVLRFYKAKAIAKGRFTATAKALQRAGVKTVDLEVSCLTIGQARTLMREKAQSIIDSAKAQASRARTPKVAAESEQVQACAMDSGDGGIPAYLADEDAAIFRDPAWVSEPANAMPAFDDEPVVQAATAPVRSAPPAPNPSVCYRGTLQRFGMEKRTFSDPKKGDRIVNHFCVRIFDEALQAEQPLWGNDLQRVIEEGGAKVGDRVDLGLIGETSVMVRGKPQKKKVWSLTRLQ